MTLYTICRDAALEVGVTPPGTIVNNSADDARKLLRYAGKAGLRCMKEVPWQVLRKEQTFTGVAGSEQTSILPSNFDRFVPETFWNRTSAVLISGPVAPQQWQGLKAGGYSGDPRFIYRGGSVFILPVLSGGESLAFEYVSNKWCQSSGGTAQTAWAADTDTGILDEELLTLATVFEYLSGEGLPNQKAGSDYMTYKATLLKNDQPTSNIMVAGDIFGGGRHYDGVPTADTGLLY